MNIVGALFRFLSGARDLFLFQSLQIGPEAHSVAYLNDYRDPFQGIKAARAEANRSPLCSAKIKN